MKLKYDFVIRNVAGQSVALAVGEDNKYFNGMIKLNSVGEFIFKLLKDDISEDDILTQIVENYNVSPEQAKSSLVPYLETLRKNELISE
ncbi:MAG: PqqD family protein [Ruminococcaceae bacterium]|nr:PqqD family protein [Oscillospiraceae bacterium]